MWCGSALPSATSCSRTRTGNGRSANRLPWRCPNSRRPSRNSIPPNRCGTCVTPCHPETSRTICCWMLSAMSFFDLRTSNTRLTLNPKTPKLLPRCLTTCGCLRLQANVRLRAKVDAIFQEVCMPRRHFLAMSDLTAVFLTSVAWIATPQGPLHAMPTGTLFRAQQGASPLTATDAPRSLVRAAYGEYPSDAFEKEISGVVLLNIVINSAGEV